MYGNCFVIGLDKLENESYTYYTPTLRAFNCYRTCALDIVIGLWSAQVVIGPYFIIGLLILLSDHGALSDFGSGLNIIGLAWCVFIGRGV